MAADLKTLLRNPAINEWRVFWLVAAPMALYMVVAMLLRDMATAEGVSAMITSSVRWSIPWLYLAFVASSLVVLVPGEASRWLLRNRKIMGLCFAMGMAWQISFIVWLVTVHTDYYVNEVYVLRDVIEGLLGYSFLLAMTVTSFKRGRQLLTPQTRHWKLLHKTGIYFLWAYAFSTYWYSVFYYDNPHWVHYLYYWLGVAALSLRIAAWVRKQAAGETAQPALAALGSVVILFGGIGAATGSLWESLAHNKLEGITWAMSLELYMPYWPFIPYLPMFAIAAGAYLLVRSRRSS